MGKVNWTGVIVGGLLAGLVINISEFVLNTFVVAEDFAARMEELGVSGGEGTGAMVVWIVLGFVWGIAAVWLYAAIRPRFGPGVKTALLAGVFLWLIAGLLQAVAMVNMGLFTAGMMVLGLVWGLVELCLATTLGAWVYKEGESEVRAPAEAAY